MINPFIVNASWNAVVISFLFRILRDIKVVESIQVLECEFDFVFKVKTFIESAECEVVILAKFVIDGKCSCFAFVIVAIFEFLYTLASRVTARFCIFDSVEEFVDKILLLFGTFCNLWI